MSIVKLSNIGNSKGVILRKRLLKEYGIAESVEVIESPEGILLKKPDNPREGWAEAFKKEIEEYGYDQIMPDFMDDDVIEEY